MIVKKFQAPTEREAIIKAQEELGSTAVVLNVKTIKHEMKEEVMPGSTRYVKMKYPGMDHPGEYVYEVSVRLEEDTAWANKGHEICFGQHVKKIEGERLSLIHI